MLKLSYGQESGESKLVDVVFDGNTVLDNISSIFIVLN